MGWKGAGREVEGAGTREEQLVSARGKRTRRSAEGGAARRAGFSSVERRAAQRLRRGARAQEEEAERVLAAAQVEAVSQPLAQLAHRRRALEHLRLGPRVAARAKFWRETDGRASVGGREESGVGGRLAVGGGEEPDPQGHVARRRRRSRPKRRDKAGQKGGKARAYERVPKPLVQLLFSASMQLRSTTRSKAVDALAPYLWGRGGEA